MNITIYGKQNCSQCVMTKNYLDARGIPYDYKELDLDFTREGLLEIAPMARVFPVIFVNGSDVGGLAGLQTRIMTEGALGGNGPSYLAE